MCFFYALSQTARSLQNRYQLADEFAFELGPEVAEPIYYVSGFDFPKMPVLTNEQPERLQAFSWGLVPYWVKTPAQAAGLRAKTLNARAETVFEKPSFRQAIRQRRCLVPADGYFEWRAFNGKKYPYYIFLRDKEVFSFAGIWEQWVDPATGEILKTYTILTTAANPLMEKIHNTKKRMPVILPREHELDWIREELSEADLLALTKPLPAESMEAHTISRFITSRVPNRNLPQVQEAYDYPELDEV